MLEVDSDLVDLVTARRLLLIVEAFQIQAGKQIVAWLEQFAKKVGDFDGTFDFGTRLPLLRDRSGSGRFGVVGDLTDSWR